MLGSYGIDINILNDVGVKSMFEALNSKDKKLIIIDEIGKMECFSDMFKKVLIQCLESQKQILATIRFNPDTFIDKIKNYKDSKLMVLNRNNYKDVKNEILLWIKELL